MAALKASRRFSDRPYDWAPPGWGPVGEVSLLETTLDDGLRATDVRQPTLREKIRLLDLIEAVGFQAVDFPSSAKGSRRRGEASSLARHVKLSKSPMGIVCVVRPRPEDAAAALELSQTAGCAVEAIVFVRGSRPTSEVPDLARRLAETSRVLVQEGVSVTCGVEDASRAMPDDLQRLVRTSLHAGATRVAIADTAGCATPWSAEAVVRFVREEIVGPRRPVGIDWRGRNALGLAVANALGAIFGGADRIHVTATGIGRGAGNASAEEMVAVLDSLGVHRWNLAQVPEYTATVSQIFRRPATAAVSAGRSKGARG